MHKLMVFAAIALPVAAFAQVASSPRLGTAEGRCRLNEPGPAFLINVVGLKDRRGQMKAELTSVSRDFLGDDSVIINAGHVFRRVVIEVPQTGPVQLCIRAPSPGAWALSILHDRDSNHKLGLSTDGVGFGTNPVALHSLPSANTGRAVAGAGVTPITIRLLYRTGLFTFSPLRNR